MVPGATVSCSSRPENLRVDNTNAGGFGTADWTQRDEPPAEGEPVTIDAGGERIFEGRIVSAPMAQTGERKVYAVSAIGHFNEYAIDEAYQGVFVDRDFARWKVSECPNWAAAPEHQIVVDTSKGLSFLYPDGDKVIVDRSDPEDSWATKYDHTGNAVPKYSSSDFAPPKNLWTAATYSLAEGLSGDTITGVALEVLFDFSTPMLDAKKTPDYTNPIGPPDAKYGHRFAKYPKVNYWTKFYGMAKPPSIAFAGLYCLDDPAELPVNDAKAMMKHESLVYLFPPRHRYSSRYRYGDNPVRSGGQNHDREFTNDDGTVVDATDDKTALPPLKLEFETSGKTLVLYSTYLPFRRPMNLGTKYSTQADHLVRTKWVAVNRVYCDPGMHLEVSKVAVFSQGYKTEGGVDDVGKALGIMFPDSDVPKLELPADPDDGSATGSIVIPPFTNKLDATARLLALFPGTPSWGFWEDKKLVVDLEPETYAIRDEPGVSVNATKTSDGAVDWMLVAYTPEPPAYVGEGLVLNLPRLIAVDKDGTVGDPLAGWTPDEGSRLGFLDASGMASSAAGAARIGQLAALQRQPDQWVGTVALKAISGACAARPGLKLSGAGIEDALITMQSIDVDQDTVTLTLGPLGYVGRFAPAVPGSPYTANPLLRRRGDNPGAIRERMYHERGR
jgi:hypothetical protein